MQVNRGRRSASRRCRRSFRFRKRIHRRSILDFARSRRAFSLPTPRKVCKSRNAIIARDQESMALQFGEQSCLHKPETGMTPTDTFVRSCNTITKKNQCMRTVNLMYSGLRNNKKAAEWNRNRLTGTEWNRSRPEPKPDPNWNRNR